MFGQYRIGSLTTRAAATFVALGIAGSMLLPSFALRTVEAEQASRRPTTQSATTTHSPTRKGDAPGISVSGRVVDADGKPVAGATVHLESLREGLSLLAVMLRRPVKTGIRSA